MLIVRLCDNRRNLHYFIDEMPDLSTMSFSKRSVKRLHDFYLKFISDDTKTEAIRRGTCGGIMLIKVKIKADKERQLTSAVSEVVADFKIRRVQGYDRPFVDMKKEHVAKILSGQYLKESAIFKAIHSKLGIDHTYKAMRDFLDQ